MKNRKAVDPEETGPEVLLGHSTVCDLKHFIVCVYNVFLCLRQRTSMGMFCTVLCTFVPDYVVVDVCLSEVAVTMAAFGATLFLATEFFFF